MADIKINYQILNAEDAGDSAKNKDKYVFAPDPKSEKRHYTLPSSLGGEYINVILSDPK